MATRIMSPAMDCGENAMRCMDFFFPSPARAEVVPRDRSVEGIRKIENRKWIQMESYVTGRSNWVFLGILERVRNVDGFSQCGTR